MPRTNPVSPFGQKRAGQLRLVLVFLGEQHRHKLVIDYADKLTPGDPLQLRGAGTAALAARQRFRR